MRYRFFKIPVMDPDEAEAALNRFCAEHRVASVERHFVADGHASFWAVCVCHTEPSEKLAAPRKSKIDYREVLDDKDFTVYAKLRSLRKTLSEREGLPAYALFTNEQMADMVRRRVTSLAALGELEGVGKARVERFGEAFLEVMRAEMAGEGKPEATDEAGAD
jgi:superfamily II DNA helicase RecQ